MKFLSSIGSYVTMFVMGLVLVSCSSDLSEDYDFNQNTTFKVNHSSNFICYSGTKLIGATSSRAAKVNGNLWYQNWERPTNVTDAEREKVIKEFSKKREGAKNDISVTWKNFWVQQVFKGDASYKDANGNSIALGSDHMNLLSVFNNLKTTVVSWNPYEETVSEYEGQYEHVNNFNNGTNKTAYTDDATHQQYNGTTLMVNMGTDGRDEQFAYQNTVDSKYHYDYIILNIDDSYYVGFDFSAEGSNPNQQVDRDLVYDDWIVKIVPGKGESIPVSRVRVMAEDLGTMSSDFDYNDIVFDILFVKDGDTYKADILLQAAGGTLPLYIGEGEGNTYEVHALFGVNTDVMVNTHAEDRGLKGRSNLAPVPFTVNLPSGKNYATMEAEDAVDALNITVKIGNNTVHLTPKASYGNYSNAPKMIVAPVGTEWVDERVLISKVYTKFVDWISDPTIEWWKK